MAEGPALFCLGMVLSGTSRMSCMGCTGITSSFCTMGRCNRAYDKLLWHGTLLRRRQTQGTARLECMENQSCHGFETMLL